MSDNVAEQNENIIKNEKTKINLDIGYNINRSKTLFKSDSTNIPLEANNIQRNNTQVKKRRKKVTFCPNFKLVDKIYFDPKEPALKQDINEEYEKEKIKMLEKKKKEIDELKILQLRKNVQDKINAQCTCSIF